MPDDAPDRKTMSEAPVDFLLLCWRYMDGPPDVQIVAELNRQLTESPAKRRWFRELAITRSSLIEALGGQSHHSAPVDMDDARRLGRKADFQVKVFRSQVRPPAVEKSGKWPSLRKIAIGGLACAAVAAGVLLIVNVWLRARSRLKANTAVHVVALSHARWVGGVKIGPDHRINLHGAITLAAGLAEVKLANGVNLVLQGPVDFRVFSPMRVGLVSGRLVATVPHTDIGFTVSTPEGSVTDLGTQFGINCEPHELTSVTVFEGYVRASIQSPSGRYQATRVLVANQAAVMRLIRSRKGTRVILTLVPPTPGEFVLPDELQTKLK
jgi:ferric-dicitrate binding protein FerR (iron transport regulator)